MLIRNITLAMAMLTTPLSLAWDNSIHKIINYIAYENLTTTTQQQVNTLVDAFREQNPSYQDFVDISTWADDLKDFQQVDMFNQWHYIRIPYARDRDIGFEPDAAHNVVWAITESVKPLKANANLPSENSYTKKIFLALLTHWVADIFQPLHTHNFYDNYHFTQGSRNGVDIKVDDQHASSLHLLWDFGLHQFREEYRQYPLSKRDIAAAGDNIMARYSGYSCVDAMEPEKWAQANRALAAFAYSIVPNPTTGQPIKLPASYITQGRAIAEKQIAMAGYCLADVLNRVFDADTLN